MLFGSVHFLGAILFFHRTSPSRVIHTVHFFIFCTVQSLLRLSVRCTFSFLHRTVPSQVIRTVHFFIFAPYSFFINYLYGMLLNYCTAQFFHKLSVRCTSSFLHRTVSSQVIRTVHFFIFAPHSSFTNYLYLLCAYIMLLSAPSLMQFLPVIPSIIHRSATSYTRLVYHNSLV